MSLGHLRLSNLLNFIDFQVVACALHRVGRAKPEATIMAKTQNDNSEQIKGKPARGKFILISVLAVFVVAGATAGGLYYAGIFPAKASETADAAKTPEPRKEAIYVPLHPAFTANFEKKGSARFLQVSVEVMTRDPEVEDLIKIHMPAIRNDLLMLFSARSSDSLTTPEGKQQLQADTLSAVQEILKRENGEAGVEAVYFTSFVME